MHMAKILRDKSISASMADSLPRPALSVLHLFPLDRSACIVENDRHSGEARWIEIQLDRAYLPGIDRPRPPLLLDERRANSKSRRLFIGACFLAHQDGGCLTRDMSVTVPTTHNVPAHSQRPNGTPSHKTEMAVAVSGSMQANRLASEPEI